MVAASESAVYNNSIVPGGMESAVTQGSVL